MSLLITNGRVLDPANGVDAVQDVLVTNGRIAKIGRGSSFRGALNYVLFIGNTVSGFIRDC